jgi:hypothetical protein
MFERENPKTNGVLISLVGVEGAGHHLVKKIFKEGICPEVVVDGLWHTPYRKLLVAYSEKPAYRALLLRRPPLDDLRAEISDALNAEFQRAGILVEGFSWPFSLPRNAIRRPIPSELTDLLPPTVPHCLVVLERDLLDCILSAHRRFRGTLEHQTAIAVDNFISIQHLVNHWSGPTFSLNFENLVTNPTVEMRSLFDYLGVKVEGNLLETLVRPRVPSLVSSVGRDSILRTLNRMGVHRTSST